MDSCSALQELSRSLQQSQAGHQHSPNAAMPRHHASHSLPLQQPRSALSARPSRSLLPDELQRLASLQEKKKEQQGSPPGLQHLWPQGLPRVAVQVPYWGTNLQQLPPTSSPLLRLGTPQERLVVNTPGTGMRQQLLGGQGQLKTLPSPLRDLDPLQDRPGTDLAGGALSEHTQCSSGSQAAQQESPGRQSSLGRFLSGMVQKVKGRSPLSRQSSVVPLSSPPASPAPVSSQKAAAGLLSAAVPKAALLQGLPAPAPTMPGPQQATTGQQAAAGASAAAPWPAGAVLQGLPAQATTVLGPMTSQQIAAGAPAAAPGTAAVSSQPLPAISEVPAQTPTMLQADTAVFTAKGAALAMQHAGEVPPLPTPAQARQPPAGTHSTSGASSSSGATSGSSSSAGSSTASGSESDSDSDSESDGGSASDLEEAGAAVDGQLALSQQIDEHAQAQPSNAGVASGGGVLASVKAESAGETGTLCNEVCSHCAARHGTCAWTFCHVPLQAALLLYVPQWTAAQEQCWTSSTCPD